MATKHPCIGRCSTSLGDDVCKGCHRTAQEVIEWNGYTREQKIVIIERIEMDVKWPELPNHTEQELRDMKQRNDADLTIVTVCKGGCISVYARLGCSCGKWVGKGAYHAYLTADGRLLTNDDVSILQINED